MGGVFQRQKSKESSRGSKTCQNPQTPIFDFSSFNTENARMSVIGIDLGNQSCFVATARAGGIELILNDYSMRDTPAYVSFHEHFRSIGVAAKNNLVVNLQNTVFNFKRLLGRKFRDPIVQEELMYLPFNVHETEDGEIGVKVTYMGKEVIFNPEQITGMLLGKLKAISEADLKVPVSDCVISVPAYFTDVERRALLAAAQIGGLHVLRLMNEPTAVALSYGLYSQELPEHDQPAKNIIFIDVGYATTQLAAVAFNKGKLKVLGTVVDANLGGRNLDYALVNYFVEDFHKRFKMDVRSNKRALIRLRDECEKLKKMMSSISNEIPLNIECFMNDKDVNGRMKREDFEQLISAELARFENKMYELLETVRLGPADLDKVEIIGGGTRTPAIKALIRKVFGVEPCTSLNQDEAVSRGCAIQCAILSPSLKVKEFSVTDICPYAIELRWPIDKSGAGHLDVFPKNHASPFSKVITFTRNEPFVLDAYYSLNQNIPHSDPWIGTFQIQDVRPTPGETSTKVRVKTRVGLSGLFAVTNAYREEVVLVEDDAAAVQIQAMETDEPSQKTDGPNEDNDGSNMEVDEKKEPKEGAVKKTKKQQKQIELRVDVKFPEYSQQQIQEFVERELEMRSQDKAEKEKADARNALEEYIYEFRDKISGDFNDFVADQDRVKFADLLRNSEEWLYSDGEDQPRSVYLGKLTELQQLGSPIANRYRESQERPALLEDVFRYMQLTRKAVDQYKAGDESLNHLDAKDIDKVVKTVDEKQRWIDDKMSAQSKRALHMEPVVTVAQLKKEKQDLENTVNPILRKQKPPPPKVTPPQDFPKKEKATEEASQPNGSEGGDPTDVPMDTQ